jgi:hypothetical protein
MQHVMTIFELCYGSHFFVPFAGHGCVCCCPQIQHQVSHEELQQDAPYDMYDSQSQREKCPVFWIKEASKYQVSFQFVNENVWY